MRLLLIITLFAALFSQAQACDSNDILTQFINKTPAYDYHDVSEGFKIISAKTSSITYYDKVIELNYVSDILFFTASNEMWGGYGAYAIIADPMTCNILDLIEVYTE